MKRRRPRPLLDAILLLALAAISLLHPAQGIGLAYIGPGAGFVFLGSFLTLLGSLLLSIFSFLFWPIRMTWRALVRRRGLRRASVRKLIFLGLDGLDPNLTERFLAEGKLPNLSRLRETGGYRRLRTTFPALSPVAWSTFATGVNPARHNIFDFLNRNLKSYVPELSSSRVRPPERVWRVGRFRIPVSGPLIENRRKSQPFWKILGEHAIHSTILRVPITFPPEAFHGKLLSAMCTPDLRGTQGSFSHFSTREETGENRYPLSRLAEAIEGSLEGPEDSFTADRKLLRLPFRIYPANDGCTFEIQGERYVLKTGEYSPWIRLRFRSALGVTVAGIARFLLTESGSDVSLYVTPIQIDPEAPALPISHPQYYAIYLAKLLGSFATLGMAEDTWALNEAAIDDEAFLEQAQAIKAEREAMFLSALDRTRSGVVACVFDTTDRVQHMFFRQHENGAADPHHGVIERLYREADELVGRALEYVDDQTVLFVLSDHGFCSFRRAVNLNSWLLRNGYLALKEGASESGRYFQEVDWSRTRAFTLGLGGLYLNLRGREACGVVAPGAEAESLKRELIARLTNLRDEERNEIAIQRVYATDDLYRGPYLDAAPDMIVGYNQGYRTSWDAAVGKVTSSIIEDNEKAWSGDHCVDPVLVPGVLFCNRRLGADNPGIEDLAPTALELFGIDAPSWMEGKCVFRVA